MAFPGISKASGRASATKYFRAYFYSAKNYSIISGGEGLNLWTPLNMTLSRCGLVRPPGWLTVSWTLSHWCLSSVIHMTSLIFGIHVLILYYVILCIIVRHIANSIFLLFLIAFASMFIWTQVGVICSPQYCKTRFFACLLFRETGKFIQITGRKNLNTVAFQCNMKQKRQNYGV